MSEGTTNICVECNEHPALGLPKKQGRLHDTCAFCLPRLKESGIDILKPMPKPPKAPGKREEKKAQRQARLDLIEQRAQRKKQKDPLTPDDTILGSISMDA